MKLTITRRTLAGWAGAACLAATLAAPAQAEEVWQGYTFHPTTGVPEYDFLERIAKQVDETTDGYLKINMSPAGSLPIKGNDVAQAVADNIIPFAAATSGTMGMVPIYGLSRLPMMFSTDEDVIAGNKAVLEEAIATALDEKDVKLLAIWWYPAHSIWSNKELNSLADISGMKLRVTSPQQADLIKQYGAIPVQIATAEVAPALQQGVVDGALTSAAGARLWIDNFKANFYMPMNFGTSLVIANKQEFEALPPEVQDKLVQAAQDGAKWVTETLAANDKGLRQSFADEKGLKIVEPTAEEVADAREKSQQIWVDNAEAVGPEGVKALEILKKELGK